MQNNRITAIIAEAIKSYTEKEYKSLNQLAISSGVALSYVHRLSLEKIESENLDPVKTFQVLKVVRNTSFAYEFAQMNPSWIQKINQWTGVHKELSEKLLENKDVEKIIISSDFNILAFILACNHCGTTITQLQKIGGGLLVQAAQELIDNGILKNVEGKIKDSTVKESHLSFTFSPESQLKVTSALIHQFNVKHRPKNSLVTLTGSFNDKFLANAQLRLREFRVWFEKERIKEENMGSKSSFLAMALDYFTED